MEVSPKSQQGLSRLCDVFFLASVAGLVAFILWLPAFPSGDGPLHTYYARIFRELASGPTFYSQYYALRHIVQPYCIHYVALMTFYTWLPTLKAEEVFVVLIVLVTAFGFRFMAGRIGRNGSLVSLFMVPLLLDWILGAGFMNNYLAIGFSFWAIGFWVSLPPAGSAGAMVGLVLTLILLMLAHPVPLLVLILLMMCDLGLVVWERRSQNIRARMQGLGWRVAALVLTSLAVLIPASMAEKSKVTSVWKDLFPHRSVFLHLVEAKRLGYFNGLSLLMLIYTLGLLTLVPATILLMRRGVLERWRTRSLTFADRQLITMTVFLVFTVVMPRTVAGGSSFSERMWDMIWPLILATGGAATLTQRAYRGLAMIGTLFIAITAVLTAPRLHELALKHQALSRVALPADARGLLLEPSSTTLGRPLQTSYPVFFWSGVRAFEASHAVLLNGPWMDERQIPVRASGEKPLAGQYLQPYTVDQPPVLTEAIEHRDPAGLRALSSADFLLYSAPNERTEELPSQMRRVLGSSAADWNCTAGSLYVLCLKAGGR